MLKLLLPVGAFAAGADWARIGPWNIFDDQNGKGEAGTLACAASPAKNPDLIYAGGQNNGVSSGIIKTVDGGKHWTRNSKGLWDTRILGVWLHPDAPTGSHVFAGTHSGVYESTDGAASWTLCKETAACGASSRAFARASSAASRTLGARHPHAPALSSEKLVAPLLARRVAGARTRSTLGRQTGALHAGGERE